MSGSGAQRTPAARLRRLARFLPALAVVALYFILGHLTYWPAGVRPGKSGFKFSQPSAVSGDEPHYLVMVNSLLFDHDIRIDPDFARIEAGGYEAGAAWRGKPFGGHSILVDPRTRRHVTCTLTCTDADAAKVGAPLQELEQYPAHPAGYPAVLALILAPVQPSAEQVEPMVGILNILMSIGGVLLTYACARRSGFDRRRAMLAAGLLAVGSSWLPYVRSYFSETAIGFFLLLGLLALRSRRPALSGLAIAVTMAMKPVFIVFGFAWIAERLLAKRLREAIWLTVTIGLCGVVLTAVNLATLRAPTTTGAIPFALAHGLKSLYETFFLPGQGLIVFVPWAGIALLWGTVMVRAGAPDQPGLMLVETRRQIVPPMLMCLATYAVVAWGPGYCYGPRYWVPLMPFLAMLAVDFAFAGKPWRRALIGVLAAASAVIALVGVTQYPVLFLKPPLTWVLGKS